MQIDREVLREVETALRYVLDCKPEGFVEDAMKADCACFECIEVAMLSEVLAKLRKAMEDGKDG